MFIYYFYHSMLLQIVSRLCLWRFYWGSYILFYFLSYLIASNAGKDLEYFLCALFNYFDLWFYFQKEQYFHLSLVIVKASKFQHFTETKRGFRILKVASAKGRFFKTNRFHIVSVNRFVCYKSEELPNSFIHVCKHTLSW